MSEQKIPIPAMLYNAAVGGHVANSQQIIDENLNREQNDINQETVGAVPYNSTTPNGMGRIVLKKNDNFKQVVEAQTNGNTIFVIKYDFTLTNDVTVPANCVLQFDGGSISGAYTLTGSNTGINAGLVKIFNTNITFAGTWNIEGWYVEWFGAKGDGVTDDTLAFQKCAEFNIGTILLQNKIYIVNGTIDCAFKHTFWKGSLFSSSTWDNTTNNTVIKYTGNQDIPLFILPRMMENITFTTNAIHNTDQTTLVGTALTLGTENNFATQGVYNNIKVKGFKIGLYLNNCFGCTFNNIELTFNYIGINVDPIKTEGVDSGYITTLSINNYEITNNNYAGITKLSGNFDTWAKIWFNNGIIEGNGSLNEYHSDIIGNRLSNLYFNNGYSESNHRFANTYSTELHFINFSSLATEIFNRNGELSMYNCGFGNCAILGTSVDGRYRIINSYIKSVENLSLLSPGVVDLINVMISEETSSTKYRSTIPAIACEDGKDAGSTPYNGIGMFKDSNNNIYGPIYKDNGPSDFTNIPSGDTANRPVITARISTFMFYDKTLKKLIIWNRTENAWLDVMGNPV